MDFLEDIDVDDEKKQAISQKIESLVEEKTGSLLQSIKKLEAKRDELLEEKVARESARREAEEAAKREAEEKAKASNDYKQLFESQQREADNLKKQLNELNMNIKRQTIVNTASKIAAGLTKDTARAKLLQEQISQRLTLVEEEIRVTDENGNPTVSSLDDLTTQIKTNFPFLVDGSQANGGGAARTQGSAEGGRKEISRSDFDNMKQGDRAKYIKEGGKVIDD
jgi:hypothetical protein